MSTLAELGSQIQHEGHLHDVVRIVDSSTLFEIEGERYILEEKYAELRQVDNGQVSFLMFSSTKHEATKSLAKGLDPSIWRRF